MTPAKMLRKGWVEAEGFNELMALAPFEVVPGATTRFGHRLLACPLLAEVFEVYGVERMRAQSARMVAHLVEHGLVVGCRSLIGYARVVSGAVTQEELLAAKEAADVRGGRQ
jgi:hypothetical protein